MECNIIKGPLNSIHFTFEFGGSQWICLKRISKYNSVVFWISPISPEGEKEDADTLINLVNELILSSKSEGSELFSKNSDFGQMGWDKWLGIPSMLSDLYVNHIRDVNFSDVL